MPIDGSLYSYMAIAHRFRSFYRNRYMKQTMAIGYNRPPLQDWPCITLPLSGTVPPDLPQADVINRSFLRISFNRDLGNEIWAMNFVSAHPSGALVGFVAVDKRLYEQIVDDREEAQKRKTILAHEFLEVLHTLCNFSTDTTTRAVANRVEMFALMGALEFGLPWQDTAAHIARLMPALRDLLVSTETIHRFIRESEHGTIEAFELHFISMLRDDRTKAENFLQRFAEHVSLNINVPRMLVRSRLDEIILARPRL